MNIHFKNIKPKSSSNENDLSILIKELESLLPLFPASDIFNRDYFEGFIEDDYTETLIKFLENTNTSSRFTFFNQYPQFFDLFVKIG